MSGGVEVPVGAGSVYRWCGRVSVLYGMKGFRVRVGISLIFR